MIILLDHSLQRQYELPHSKGGKPGESFYKAPGLRFYLAYLPAFTVVLTIESCPLQTHF
jgi:hypothetical protein